MLVPDFHVDFNAEEPQDNWDQLEAWLSQIIRALEENFGKARMDIEFGHTTHRIYTATPAVTDVENGEVVFVDTGSGTRLGITKLDGVLYKWNLATV
jgi:hypothetical protein